MSLSEISPYKSACLATIHIRNIYIRVFEVEDSLYKINVFYLINLLTTIRIKLNSVLVMGSLNDNSFITKFNNTKPHALSETYNSYSSLYGRCLPLLVR